MSFGSVQLMPVNGKGPEDVVVDAEGRVFTGLDDGRIVRFSEAGTRIDVVADTGGRPLGIELYGDDELLVCDAQRGLLAVALRGGRVRTLATEGAGARLVACNNAAVCADGMVYFTDSSARFPISRWRDDLIEQTGTGRLLRRAPDGAIDTVLSGLQFANGVALAPDESFVTVAETGACRVRRVWLSGSRSGESGMFLDDLRGYPDNTSTGSDGLIWVTQASPRVAALDLARRLPPSLRAGLRRVPEALQPSPARGVGVLAVRPDGTVAHEVRGEIEGLPMLTGVREYRGWLYLGSLIGRAVAMTHA